MRVRKTARVVCSKCEGEFEKSVYEIVNTEKRNGKHFCSLVCAGAFKKTAVITQCGNCGVGVERKAQEFKDSKSGAFCSRSCSVTFQNRLRRGINNPNHINRAQELASNGKTASNNHYRTICFAYHEKKCVVCGEDKIVAVHHHDGNHDNNDPMNLVPLCPTHHGYWHSKWRYLIEDKVKEYRELLYERLPLLEADNVDYELCEEELGDLTEVEF